MTDKGLFRNHIGEVISSVILGFLEILALSLYYRDSIGFWLKSVVNVLIFIGLWILAAAVIFAFFRLITALLAPKRIIREKPYGEPPLTERHPFLISALVLTVFYLPWIIAFYPGSAIYDMMYQTVQADGFMAINAHHPIFATYVIGLCSKIGLMITGKLNLGIFLYILLQTAVCILGFSHMLSFLSKLGVKRGYWFAVLCFLAVPPLWGGAMQCGTKDTLFTGLFVIFLVESAQLLLKDRKPVSAARWVLYGLLILLLCLYRNAILVILIPTLAVFFFLLGRKKERLALAVTAVLALALAGGFGMVTKQVYHTKTETGEMLSIPFQQTARYVRDHGEEVTEEEAEKIEKVFRLEDYKKLGKLYYPMSSDPVKARYHWWASDEEKQILSEYAVLWGSMLKKHPETYLEALLSQTYGYYSVTPVFKNQKGGAGTCVQFGPDEYAVRNVIDASGGQLSESLIPESPEVFSGAREILSGWYRLWQKLPVLGLLFKCGFYFYILLALTLRYGKRKNRMIVLSIPCFLLILMAIASPVNEHIRYILPAVAALPLLAGAAAAEEKYEYKET